jgi:hypothetical protein
LQVQGQSPARLRSVGLPEAQLLGVWMLATHSRPPIHKTRIQASIQLAPSNPFSVRINLVS